MWWLPDKLLLLAFLFVFFLHKKFVILNMRLIVFCVLSDIWYRGELVINRAHTIHVKIISFIRSEIWKPIIIRVSLMKWDEKEYKKSPVLHGANKRANSGWSHIRIKWISKTFVFYVAVYFFCVRQLIGYAYKWW